MNGRYTMPLRIGADHPALAGHFPGHPVVPGVVLLERVAAALAAWRGQCVARLDAKFLQPLAPDEDAWIELVPATAPRVGFTVTRSDGVVLTRGSLEAAA